MTFSHALSTNNYGPYKFIVATSAANGTHTTLAAALAVASSGDTVYLRDSVTENVTIPAGVEIVGAGASQSSTITSITGKITMTAAGSSTLRNLRLITNSDFAIVVSGSNATSLDIRECSIIANNNTAISFTNSNASSSIIIDDTFCDVMNTGISLFASSSNGTLTMSYCRCANSGGTSTASTTSAAQVTLNYCLFPIPLSASSTGFFVIEYCDIDTSPTNTTCITTAGTSSGHQSIFSRYRSGTASSVSVGSGTTVQILDCSFNSSNANVLTGAGTINYSFITFFGSSSGHNVTTENALATLI